jgi:hypothetical protein
MENFNTGNPLNQPRPVNKDINQSIPFDNPDPGGSGVSHAPLDLGGTSPIQIPKVEAPKLVVVKKPMEKTVSTSRIAGVKTFFTKLHPGAMTFLDEQITRWLTENPKIQIKQTNVTTGEVQAKKTEPNIIITVWY